MTTKSAEKLYLLGVCQVLAANSFVGLNVIFNKYLVRHLPIFILLELRYFFGSMLLFLICLFHKNRFQFYASANAFSKQDTVLYFFMSICGGMLFNCIYMTGLKHTTATATGIISSAIPTLIVILSYFILKQKINRTQLICVAMVVAGLVLLNTFQSGDNQTIPYQEFLFGNTIVFLGMIPEALFTVLAKKLQTPVYPIMSALVINVINLSLCLPMALWELSSISFHITAIAWLFSFCIGLFSSTFFYIFYNSGIAKIDSSTAALLTGAIPVSTAILAFLFLNEHIGIVGLLGMSLVLGSIYFGVRYPNFSK